MTMFEEIAKFLTPFGEKLAVDLRAELKAGLKNVQEPNIRIDPKVTASEDKVVLQIQMDDYWKNIIDGRGKNKKPPPSRVFGKKWQNEHAIDARKILAQIEIRRKVSKNGLKVGGKGRLKDAINKHKKTLNYAAAVKSVSFMIARSVGIKGVKPIPFIKTILDDGRLQALQDSLAPIIMKNLEIQIKIFQD